MRQACRLARALAHAMDAGFCVNRNRKRSKIVCSLGVSPKDRALLSLPRSSTIDWRIIHQRGGARRRTQNIRRRRLKARRSRVQIVVIQQSAIADRVSSRVRRIVALVETTSSQKCSDWRQGRRRPALAARREFQQTISTRASARVVATTFGV